MSTNPLIVIDGLTFQLQAKIKGGISRIWKNILPLMAAKMPQARFLLLQRGNNDPGIPGLEKITVPPYSYATFRIMDADTARLSRICHEEGARIFMSSYYSQAPGIFTVQMVYDMIPELFGANAEIGMWRSKRKAFQAANSFVSISESTRRDLKRFYDVEESGVSIAYPGVSPEFRPAGADEIAAFKAKHGIAKPFYLIVGTRWGYKNVVPVYKGFLLSDLAGPCQIITVGGEPPDQYEAKLSGAHIVHLNSLTDAELRAAFSSAVAFVYPSKYEGFGMPIAEALACGCPVITCNNSSLPEAGGNNCLYADPDSPESFVAAMRRITEAPARERLVPAGLSYVQKFTWEAMADAVVAHLERELTGPAAALNPAVQRRSRARSLVLQGQEFEKRGDRAAAAEAYKDALQADGDYYLPYFALGLAAEKNGDITQAQRAIEKATSLETESRNTRLAYARIMTRQGGGELALPALYTYFDRHPTDGDLLTAIAKAESEWCRKTLAASTVVDTNYRRRPYKISAIVSTYNAGDFIVECLGDLEAQTVAGDIEIIVIDAHSPQKERELVADFMTRHDNIRYVRTAERIGVYAAWNLAIHLSRGAYLTPFSTNDRLRPETYAILGKFLDDNPETALVYGDSYLTEKSHQAFGSADSSGANYRECRWPEFNYTELLFRCMIGPHPLWRSRVHDEIGCFDSRSTAVGDQDFWLRLARSHRLSHMREFTGLICLKPDSLSLMPQALRETLAIHVRHIEDYLLAINGDLSPSTLDLLLQQFLEMITRLVERGENHIALAMYHDYRELFITTPELREFDSLLNRLRAKQA